MSERLLRGARAESATTGARDTKSRRHSRLEMPSGYLALNCRTQSNLSTYVLGKGWVPAGRSGR